MFRDLSDRLNLSRAEGEKWIVNLIRETRMGADAKIDLEKVRCVSCPWSCFNCSTSYPMPKPSRTTHAWGFWTLFQFGPGVTLDGWALEESSPVDSYSAIGSSRQLFAHAAADV